MNNSEPKRIFLSPPHLSGEEMRFVHEAFESNYIAPLGPQVDAFELEFAEKVGISHALALSSGTAAMHLALRVLGVGQGDEVIASTLTFIGSVTPIVFQGATPVFIDCDRTTWNMDPGLLQEELAACQRRGQMPKAVIPTDLYGQCADLDRILEICAPYEIPVVPDSAEALGAKYGGRQKAVGSRQIDGKQTFSPVHIERGKNSVASRGKDRRPKLNGLRIEQGRPQLNSLRIEQGRHAGVGAKAAIFSFNGNKIITTSGGGMLASDNEDFIEQARFLSQQARDQAPHYEHTQIGYNYRMSNILAAIGRGQLRVLDERVKKKREIFDYYQEALGDLPGIEFMPEAPYGRSNRWLTVMLITPEEFGADRETVRIALEAENIEARPVWKPMHLQPVFDSSGQNTVSSKQTYKARVGRIENLGIEVFRYPGIGRKKIRARAVGGEVAEDLFNRGLCLPSGTAMKEEDLNRVIEVIRICRTQGRIWGFRESSIISASNDAYSEMNRPGALVKSKE